MAAGQTEASTTKPASDTEGEIPEQPEPSYSADHGLTDDQLMEVFKQTSIFNVKSALANNQNLMQNETAEDEQQEFFSDSDISDTEEWDYLRGFWSGDHLRPCHKSPQHMVALTACISSQDSRTCNIGRHIVGSGALAFGSCSVMATPTSSIGPVMLQQCWLSLLAQASITPFASSVLFSILLSVLFMLSQWLSC